MGDSQIIAPTVAEALSDANKDKKPPPVTQYKYMPIDDPIQEVKTNHDTTSPSFCYLFNKEKHVTQLLNNIRYFWNDDDMIDVRIASDDKHIFNFHGMVLAGYSPKVFRNILTNGNMQWFNGILAPKGVTAEQLTNLQDCIYRPDVFAHTMAKSDDPSVMTNFATFFGLEEMAVNAFIPRPLLLENWENLFNQRCLTFAVLKNGDDELPVHAPILAACSPLFQEQYVNNPDDPLSMLHNVYHADGYKFDVVQKLIEYIYTAKLKINKDSVGDLLLSACKMNMIGATKACCDFIKNTLHSETCLFSRHLAKEGYLVRNDPFLKELYHDIEKYIISQFIEVIEADNFKEYMTEEDIVKYLARANVNGVQTSVVITAMLRWNSHDVTGRTEALSRILSVVTMMMDANGLIKSTALAYKQNNQKHALLGHVAALLVNNTVQKK